MKMWGMPVAVCAGAATLLAMPLTGCSTSTSAAAKTTATKVPAAVAPSTSTPSGSSTVSTPSVTTPRATAKAAAAVRLPARVGDTLSGVELEKLTQRAKRGKSAHMSQTIGAQHTPFMQGIVSFSADGTATEKLTEQIAGKKADLVYAGDVLYLSIPSEGSGWLAVRSGGTDTLSKQLAPLLATIRQSEAGQSVGIKGVTWTVTSVTRSQVTYQTHLTAPQVKAASAKVGADKILKVRPTSEDLVEVFSRTGLPLRLDILIHGAGSLHLTYGSWGPAITITPPEDYTEA